MMRRKRPIVICGAARSGTTALSIMLNQHAEIGLAREIELYKLPSISPLLSETAKHHRGAWTAERRAEVVRALWYYVGRPVPHNKRNLRRWGTKSPWSEFDYQLWDPLISPLWVYVLRRGDRVFQSHIRLGWSEGRNPGVLIHRYKESVRLGDQMQARKTAHICQLDLATNLSDRRQLAQGLFDFLEEEIDPSVADFIEKWPTHLSATHPTNDGGPAGEVNLPDEWQQLLDDDQEYQELMHAHGY